MVPENSPRQAAVGLGTKSIRQLIIFMRCRQVAFLFCYFIITGHCELDMAGFLNEEQIVFAPKMLWFLRSLDAMRRRACQKRGHLRKVEFQLIGLLQKYNYFSRFLEEMVSSN